MVCTVSNMLDYLEDVCPEEKSQELGQQIAYLLKSHKVSSQAQSVNHIPINEKWIIVIHLK